MSAKCMVFESTNIGETHVNIEEAPAPLPFQSAAGSALSQIPILRIGHQFYKAI